MRRRRKTNRNLGSFRAARPMPRRSGQPVRSMLRWQRFRTALARQDRFGRAEGEPGEACPVKPECPRLRA